jgi:hypothetical protein
MAFPTSPAAFQAQYRGWRERAQAGIPLDWVRGVELGDPRPPTSCCPGDDGLRERYCSQKGRPTASCCQSGTPTGDNPVLVGYAQKIRGNHSLRNETLTSDLPTGSGWKSLALAAHVLPTLGQLAPRLVAHLYDRGRCNGRRAPGQRCDWTIGRRRDRHPQQSAAELSMLGADKGGTIDFQSG